MKHILSSTAVAAALVFGGYGLASAQAVNPGQPGQLGHGSSAGMDRSAAESGSQTPNRPAASGATQAASRMNEDQIRNALQARGYSDINGLERDGDAFKVREAKRFGEKVENLRVDASTGQVRDEQRLSEDQVRTMLRDRGYSEVNEVKRDGNTITARAKRDGNEVRLRVDASTGIVSRQQASN